MGLDGTDMPRSIQLLTLHQADVLGDKVAILANGRLRAVGTPLFLKARFGTGYEINILSAAAEHAPSLEALVAEHLPGGEDAGQGRRGPALRL